VLGPATRGIDRQKHASRFVLPLGDEGIVGNEVEVQIVEQHWRDETAARTYRRDTRTALSCLS